MTIEEMRARRAEIASELKSTLEDAKREERDLSDDENTARKSLLEEADRLKDRIETETRAQALAEDLKRPVSTPPPPVPAGAVAPAVHVREDREYSLLALFRAMKSGDWRSAKVERRVSDEISEVLGKDAEGAFVPYRALMPRGYQARDVQAGDAAGTASGGASVVATDLIPSEFIELLRAESVVVRLGARMLPNLVGDVEIPRQSAGATAVWLATETTNLTADTAFGMDQVTLSPKTVGIRADVTRRMLKQSSPGIEDIVRGDIRAQIGLAVDAAAIDGSGAAGQPTGITNTVGIGTVDLTVITWADIVEFESDLGAANALRGSLAYAVPPALAGTLKATLKDTGGGEGYILGPGNMMNGYMAEITTQVTAGEMLFGNWNELLIGMWGTLDVFGDPFTQGDYGGLVVRGFQDVDIAVRHAASFSHGS